MLRLLLFVSCLSSVTLVATEEPETTLASAFEFWVGDWDLTWTNANGTLGTGTNRIEKILDGKALQENFSAASGFKGRSLSVYNPKTQVWRQSWVDNQGAYLSFTYEVDGSKRNFKIDPIERNGTERKYNIPADVIPRHREGFLFLGLDADPG
ncbi:hypothetical protein N9X40_01885 [bacterium]|nr:hypothetical protein [bacterium]